MNRVHGILELLKCLCCMTAIVGSAIIYAQCSWWYFTMFAVVVLFSDGLVYMHYKGLVVGLLYTLSLTIVIAWTLLMTAFVNDNDVCNTIPRELADTEYNFAAGFILSWTLVWVLVGIINAHADEANIYMTNAVIDGNFTCFNLVKLFVGTAVITPSQPLEYKKIYGNLTFGTLSQSLLVMLILATTKRTIVLLGGWVLYLVLVWPWHMQRAVMG